MRAGTVLLLLGAMAWAQSREQYVDQLETAIKAGGIAAVGDRISVGLLASEPEWARRICAAAVKCDLRQARRSKDKLLTAAVRIRKVGLNCSEENDGNPDAWTAAADGMYFHLKAKRACGEETETQDWLDVAEALEKLHQLQADGGAPLERAVLCLREGQRAKGVEAAELKAREDEICKAGAKLYPNNGTFAGNQQRATLEELVALLDAGRHKEVKPRLQKLLGSIKDDTLYNDAVTVSKQHYKKLRIKAKYRSSERKFYGVFVGEFPRGDRWKIKGDTIWQYGRDGLLIRSFAFDYFKRNTWYTLGDTKYDGHNVKGMALITERDVLSVIVKVKRRTKIIKRRLNRKITGVQYFVIGGHTKDAEFNRFHSYVWKGKERAWNTYRLWIIELEDYEGLDPEAKFVLESIRETKYKKK